MLTTDLSWLLRDQKFRLNPLLRTLLSKEILEQKAQNFPTTLLRAVMDSLRKQHMTMDRKILLYVAVTIKNAKYPRLKFVCSLAWTIYFNWYNLKLCYFKLLVLSVGADQFIVVTYNSRLREFVFVDSTGIVSWPANENVHYGNVCIIKS